MNTKNTTPAVPLGVPGGAHTVGGVMDMVDMFAAAERRDYLSGEGSANYYYDTLRIAITRLVSDRDVLLETMTRIAHWGGTTKFYGNGSYTDVARAAIQKVQP